MDDFAFIISVDDAEGNEYASLCCGAHASPLTTEEVRDECEKALARYEALNRAARVRAEVRGKSPQEYVAWHLCFHHGYEQYSNPYRLVI